jgi:hypothetical protein
MAFCVPHHFTHQIQYLNVPNLMSSACMRDQTHVHTHEYVINIVARAWTLNPVYDVTFYNEVKEVYIFDDWCLFLH